MAGEAPDPESSNNFTRIGSRSAMEVNAARILETIGDEDSLPSGLEATANTSTDKEAASTGNRLAPLLFQRPQSSGIDVSAFSFARPAQKRKGILLQNSARRVSLNVEKAPSPHPTAEGGICGNNERFVAAEDRQSPFSPSIGPEHHGTGNYRVDGRTLDLQFRRPTKTRDLESNTQFNPPAGSVDKGTTSVTSLLSNFNDQPGNATEPGDTRPSSFRSIQVEQQGLPSVRARDRSSSRVSNISSNDTRVLKRRHNSREGVPTKRRTTSQKTEQDLFEQLINKIRQREEKQVASASLQRQTESENTELKGENQSLKEDLEACQVKLQKKMSESKVHKAQMDSWKVKLGKFKEVVNGLGEDYGMLKEHSDRFMTTAESLEKERDGIVEEINEIRADISQATNTIDGQREKLAESRRRIAVLEQDLQHSDASRLETKLQMSEERKRVLTLETFIQNHTRSQSRQLGVVRDDQGKILIKLGSVLELISETASASEKVIVASVLKTLDECVSSAKELRDACSAERTDAQLFTSTVQEVASRIDSIASQFSNDIDKSTVINTVTMQSLIKELQSVKRNLGSDSSLFRQLIDSESAQKRVERKLDAVEPAINKLDTSVKSLETTEHNISRGLEGFGEKLDKAQLVAANPALDVELSNKSVEITRLQSQLQEVSAELRSFKTRFTGTEAEKERLLQSLNDVNSKKQAFEDRAINLECAKVALQDEIRGAEQKTREELIKANTVSQNNLKVTYKQQLQGLEKEKKALEKESAKLQKQVEKAEGALVQATEEAKKERRQQDAMLGEMRQQIKELKDVCSGSATKLDLQVNEMISMRGQRDQLQMNFEELQTTIHDLEVSLNSQAKNEKLETVQTAQQIERLQALIRQKDEELRTVGQNLDAANSANTDLQASLQTQTEIGKSEAAHALQSLESLQAKICQKDEELQIVNQNLDAANSAKSSLEMGKEKAKTEIHSLLRRVQEGEGWLKTIREGAAKFTTIDSRESFAHTWSKLETILQSAAEAPGEAPAFSTRKEVATDSGIAVSTKRIVTSTPDKGKGSSAQGLMRTRDLSQQPSIVEPAAVYASEQRDSSPSVIANNDTESSSNIPDPTSNISFASIGTRHSMSDDLISPFDDPAELEMLFMSTPDVPNQAAPLRVPAPAPIEKDEVSILKEETLMRRRRPDRRSSGSDLDRVIGSPASPSVAGAAGEIAKTEHPTVKRKAVSFGQQHSATEPTEGSRQGSIQVEEDLDEDQSSKKTKRVHVHTYSRKRSDQASQKVSASQTVTSENICVETMQHTTAQGTNIGAAQHPKASRKLADASDVLERRVSPRNLVSVGSQSHAAGQNTAGRRRRRSRGERYSARFDKEE
ncbi:hypothetical protein N7474_003025 [Penicillium riverlandense]|uniref:uncharacterized protein n=1 Tax=Penicillium riverlandense TaxID=1903569 RepID=UPI002546775E|nr:uncharacterized protein N7474_003025 [Penicillium riverlandense]KAJ5825887.1 hypothetical protein N7474_003025 [Penicillium riverlandense]